VEAYGTRLSKEVVDLSMSFVILIRPRFP
jgi:hypothetical protein